MNRVEVWSIENEYEIEETVNRWCMTNNLKPLSISVTYSARKDLYVVALVVKEKTNE